MPERSPKSIGERFRRVTQRIDNARITQYLRGVVAHILDLDGTLGPRLDNFTFSKRSGIDKIRSDWEKAIDEYGRRLGYKSPLEMTAEEMSELGTPPVALVANPEKTWAEVMSDEEVATYLRKSMDSIRFLSERADTDPFAKRALPTFKRNLSLSIDYLSRINKLPEEFRDIGKENKF